jgi:hypothetical protein
MLQGFFVITLPESGFEAHYSGICWWPVPSSLSLIRHAAMVAILLCHWRRRLHWKNLPCELSGWRYHFAVPTASSSTWFAGSTNHTIAIIRAWSRSGESHCALARHYFHASL